MGEKTTDLSAFKRVLSYVWPQWPRLLALFFWAGMISLMFSASFLTIIPLLKVMMAEEGLHSWVDRKVCNWRYGLDFYVPSRNDFFDTSSNVTRHLLINRVDDKSWGKNAKLRLGDQISEVTIGTQAGQDVSMAKMLEKMATSDADQPFLLSVQRTDTQGMPQTLLLTLKTPEKPFYAELAQWPISFIPRSEKKEDTLRAMIVVIVGLTVITIIRCWARYYQY